MHSWNCQRRMFRGFYILGGALACHLLLSRRRFQNVVGVQKCRVPITSSFLALCSIAANRSWSAFAWRGRVSLACECAVIHLSDVNVLTYVRAAARSQLRGETDGLLPSCALGPVVVVVCVYVLAHSRPAVTWNIFFIGSLNMPSVITVPMYSRRLLTFVNITLLC